MRADISFVKAALSAADHRPNRALGQNFCIAGDRLASCVAAMRIDEKPVLEIGAGLGALTELLLPRCATLLAVEKDAALAKYLSESLKDPKLTVVCADALKYNADMPDGFVAVGNLPYSITTPLCSALLERQPDALYCMVQKEAGERFFAAPGDDNYGPLSVVCALYYKGERMADFSEDCFYPQPNVQSVFVGLERREDTPTVAPHELMRFTALCLHMRRKTLKNNLASVPKALDALKVLGISPATRGETLTPAQFLALYQRIVGADDNGNEEMKE